MIRAAGVLLLLSACQTAPVGPASLQLVAPDYYSRTLRYHGTGAVRGEAAPPPPRKARDGAVTITAPEEEAPEGFTQDTLSRHLARLQEELKRLRERIDWEQNSGAWRTNPGEVKPGSAAR